MANNTQSPRARKLNTFAWVLSLVVVILCVVSWGQEFNWQFGRLYNYRNYRLFPLFGLLAFSLMWSHYVVAAIRTYLNVPKTSVKRYFEFTSDAVLVFILAHPGLLWWQLWRDGFGLPPGSYKYYVGRSLVWVAILGTISLTVFLAYEFRRVFAKKSWWKLVQYASDAAMLAIVYHSFRLGTQLQKGWFRWIWWFFAVTLVASIAYTYWRRQNSNSGAGVAKNTSNQG